MTEGPLAQHTCQNTAHPAPQVCNGVYTIISPHMNNKTALVGTVGFGIVWRENKQLKLKKQLTETYSSKTISTLFETASVLMSCHPPHSHCWATCWLPSSARLSGIGWRQQVQMRWKPRGGQQYSWGAVHKAGAEMRISKLSRERKICQWCERHFTVLAVGLWTTRGRYLPSPE